MKYLLSIFLLFSACSGVNQTVARYEPPMELVTTQADVLATMLRSADINQDGRLNWFEALLVLDAWITQLRNSVEESSQ